MRLGLAVAFVAMSATGALAGNASAFNWTGFYMGVHGGMGVGYVDFPDVNAEYDTQILGALIGLQAGYGMALGNGLILGFEGTLSLNAMSADKVVDVVGGGSLLQHEATNFQWSGTATARLGYLIEDNLMLYGKAGLALASYEARGFDVPGPTTTGVTNSMVGLVLGVGAEYAVNDNWSVGVEYNFTNYGTHNRKNNYTFTYDTAVTTHALLLHLNYRPGWN